MNEPIISLSAAEEPDHWKVRVDGEVAGQVHFHEYAWRVKGFPFNFNTNMAAAQALALAVHAGGILDVMTPPVDSLAPSLAIVSRTHLVGLLEQALFVLENPGETNHDGRKARLYMNLRRTCERLKTPVAQEDEPDGYNPLDAADEFEGAAPLVCRGCEQRIADCVCFIH